MPRRGGQPGGSQRKPGAQTHVRRAHPARWRGLRFTEFELRQIAAVRKELDQEYKASIRAAGKAPRFQQIRALTGAKHGVTTTLDCRKG
jgi:hypothetical protein